MKKPDDFDFSKLIIFIVCIATLAYLAYVLISRWPELSSSSGINAGGDSHVWLMIMAF